MRNVPNSLISSAVLCLVSLVSAGARAQERTLLVESNQPDALVFADSLLLGRAGEEVFRIPPDAQTIFVRPAEAVSWSIGPLEFDVAPMEQDTVEISARFPYYYSIRSVPAGANVRMDGVEVGLTPLVIARERPVHDSLIVVLDGFEPLGLDPGARLWNHYDVDLGHYVGAANFRSITPVNRRKWIDYAALGVAAIGGAVAVHYKFKADRRYAVYEETGDPALRPEIKRLDVKSGIALGAMQTGITVFAIRLIRR